MHFDFEDINLFLDAVAITDHGFRGLLAGWKYGRFLIMMLVNSVAGGDTVYLRSLLLALTQLALAFKEDDLERVTSWLLRIDMKCTRHKCES